MVENVASSTPLPYFETTSLFSLAVVHEVSDEFSIESTDHVRSRLEGTMEKKCFTTSHLGKNPSRMESIQVNSGVEVVKCQFPLQSVCCAN